MQRAEAKGSLGMKLQKHACYTQLNGINAVLTPLAAVTACIALCSSHTPVTGYVYSLNHMPIPLNLISVNNASVHVNPSLTEHTALY